ncbi:MAG: MarR family transcriptional regulator [Candidatus Jordarchaeaceae archaeon]
MSELYGRTENVYKVGTAHLPPSALVVMEILRREGSLTPKDIFQRTSLSPRTVRGALKTLMENNLIEKVPNLLDLRQNKYRLPRLEHIL